VLFCKWSFPGPLFSSCRHGTRGGVWACCWAVDSGVVLSDRVEQLEVEWFAKDPDPQRQGMGLWTMVGEFTTAVYGALFCYGGWETVSSNEMRASF
jgi:hypothetical protein